jgi:hypothetical protein
MSFPSAQQIPIPPTTITSIHLLIHLAIISRWIAVLPTILALSLERVCCKRWIRIVFLMRIVPPTIALLKAGFLREILVDAPVLTALVVQMTKHVSTMSVKDPMVPMTILSFRLFVPERQDERDALVATCIS